MSLLVVSNMFNGTYTNFGGYTIVKIRSNDGVKCEKTNLVNVLVVDNSGSMGRSSHEAVQTIGKGMFGFSPDRINICNGAVIIFQEDAQLITNSAKTTEDIQRIVLPQQGQTNITAGVKMAIEHIISDAKLTKEKRHYVMTFLSDGQHNYGESINRYMLDTWRAQINSCNITLSVIIVGITSDSQTALGMQIKSALETAPITGLESVYFASTQYDMNYVLSKLIGGCTTSLTSGKAVEIKIENGIFTENQSSTVNSFVTGDYTPLVIKNTHDKILKIYANNQEIVLEETKIIQSDISLIIDLVLPKLSQLRIANGVESIKKQIDVYTSVIDEFEKFCDLMTKANKKEKEEYHAVEDIGKIKLTPTERLSMIKKIKYVKQECNIFQQERNKLKQLCVTISNNSANQAEYLTGITKKYAAKAVMNSNTIGTTPEQIVNNIMKYKQQICDSLDKDIEFLKKRKDDEIESSILSLNNPYEQLLEWKNVIENPDDTMYNDIYAVLVALGFPAYSVKFQQNNAVQMDPFQTECTYIETCPIDTPSLMLSNQLNNKMTSFSRTEITDGLILINPIAPNTSRTLMKIENSVYQYLCSVTLCRDLYMYHPNMTFAMHSHALLKTIETYFGTKSTAYLDLAIRIVYSMKKFWGDFTKGTFIDLFKHWWCDWGTLTQKEDDGCNHPVQLLMILACINIKHIGGNISEFKQPFINMINEVMARKMKIKMRGIYQQQQDAKQASIKMLQNMFDITIENSPKPNPDVLIEEPSVIAVRESCARYADINPDSNILKTLGLGDNVSEEIINDLVEKQLSQYLKTFQFAILMQEHTDTLIQKMEDNDIQDIKEKIAEKLDKSKQTIYDCLNTKVNKNIVYKNIFMQALLCHESDDRIGIDTKYILDPDTFSDMIIDLRMANYFEACKIKKEQWLRIIGNVTEAQAMTADVSAFVSMIGLHTHGLCREKFWALLRASIKDDDKKREFVSRSNQSIGTCYENPYKR